MKKLIPLLVPLFLVLSTNQAIADVRAPIYTTIAASFTIPYNLNYDFKMNAKENIPYLTTITQENNSKTLKLWQIQEADKSVTTSQVANYPIPVDQDPKNLHLALGYTQNNSSTISNQYMAYIDRNHQDSLVILQTYSNGIRTLINENYPMKNIDAIDMVVEKDGNLIVATIDHSRHVHLYKYITQFSGPTPVYTTLIGTNSQLVAPLTANPDQLKLALTGPDDVPYVVFPHPDLGGIATAYAATWHPNTENSSSWSTSYVADFDGTGANREANSPINMLVTTDYYNGESTLWVAFHSDAGFIGLASFGADKLKWSEYPVYTRFSDLTGRYPILATDGKEIYGTYAQSYTMRSTYYKKSFTSGRLFQLNYDNEYGQLQTYGGGPSTRSDVDNIKYTGLVMHSQDFPSHYLGFVLTQDGDNSSNLVIKGFVLAY